MVFIVPPNGEKFALDVNPNTATLHQLKVAIEEINGMPVSNQRLSLSLSLGQNDSDLMSNLGIQPFSTLTLHGADDTTSSTVKEELVNEADSEPESESDDEEAKAGEEAYEYFIDSDSDVDDKIEKKLPNHNFFEFRRKRLAAEIEDKCFSAMAKIAKEKLLTHMNEQEYEKILEEEEKKAMDDELKEVEEDRKQAEKKAKKEAKKKAKKARKELDMKAEEAKEG